MPSSKRPSFMICGGRGFQIDSAVCVRGPGGGSRGGVPQARGVRRRRGAAALSRSGADRYGDPPGRGEPSNSKKDLLFRLRKKEKKMMRRGRVCRPLVQSSYRGSEDSEGCRISKELWRRSCRRRLRESGRSWSKRPRSRASVLCCCVESSSATYKLQCQGIRTCGSVSGHVSWCIERAGWRGWHRFLATSFY